MAQQKATSKRVWQPAFLAAFANTGVVRAACMAAGIERSTAYRAKDRDPKFAAAWEQAREDAADSLEAEAVRRARAGSDTLLIFLLKAVRPEKYRETTRHELTGKNGGPIAHVSQSELDRDIDALLAEMAHREKVGAEGSAEAESGLEPVGAAHPLPQAEDVP